MKRSYLLIFSFFALILLFFLDGQISTFFANLLPLHYHIISHCLFIALMWLSIWYSKWQGLLVAFSVGILYDLYYHHILGMAIFFFPFMVYFIMKWNTVFLKNIWTSLLCQLLAVFFFEMITYLIALGLGLTSRSLTDFVLYSLLFSLFFNLLLVMISYPFCRKIFI